MTILIDDEILKNRRKQWRDYGTMGMYS